MYSFQLQLTDLRLHRNDIYLNLGYGCAFPDENIIQMLEQVLLMAHKICHPKVGFILCNGKLLERNRLQINDVSMKIGHIIGGYLEQSTLFGVFVATAGKEYDSYLHQLKRSGDIVNEFLADAVGSEITEAAVRYVIQLIDTEAKKNGFSITKPYSPGYCGWNVREQKLLFSLLPPEPCGIKLNNSCLMHPVKSVSGIVGIGEEVKDTPYACDICGLKSCYKRKVSI